MMTVMYFVGVFRYTVHLSVFPVKARLFNKVSSIYMHIYDYVLTGQYVIRIKKKNN